jgi:serine O-acetyltransferase
MILTTQAYPLASHLTEQVRRRAKSVDGIKNVEVNILDEPWNWDKFALHQRARV